MKTYEDLSDKKFGKLVALSFYEKDKYRKSKWLCVCDCGNVVIVFAFRLKSGRTRSCGCLAKGNHTTHGMTHSGEYPSWEGMKNRCDNPRHQDFKDYGGRGITYQESWGKFENFFDDMGKRPQGTSIDRIENNGNYTSGNCRWATPREQANNKRNNRVITFRDQTMTLQQWSDKIGISSGALSIRLKEWPINRALTEGKYGK